LIYFASFIGSHNYSSSTNQTFINVQPTQYELKIIAPVNARINSKITIKVILNSTYGDIANKTINLSLSVIHSSGEISTIYLISETDENGTALFEYTIPSDSAGLQIIATYSGTLGEYSISNPTTIITVADWILILQGYTPLILLILIIVIVLIVVLVLYYKVFKPKTISLADKRKKLVIEHAEARREINKITQELNDERSKAVSDAKEALISEDLNTAEKLYKKVGNISLELADKSLAKEFFSKAEEIKIKSNEKKRKKDLYSERSKYLNNARSAIQDRNINVASEYYKKTAEVSRALGDMDSYSKYMKLSESAAERVRKLQAGDLRSDAGELLEKADKFMAKQNFLEAAKMFEEAASIFITIGEEEGTDKFTTWAKLARQRDIPIGEPKDHWKEKIKTEIKKRREIIKDYLENGRYNKAIKHYLLLAILYKEIDDNNNAEKAIANAETIEEKIEFPEEMEPKNKELVDKRVKYIEKAQELEKNGQFPQSSRYYRMAAQISHELGEDADASRYSEKSKQLVRKVRRIQQEEEGKEEIQEVKEEEITEAQKELAEINLIDYRKKARDAQNNELYALALYYYQEIEKAYQIMGDSAKIQKTLNKIKELKAKIQVEDISPDQLRAILPRLSAKSEKLYKKENYEEAENLFRRIADIFFTLNDFEAGKHYINRAEIASKKIKK
jgi:hypothetical protein